MSTLPPTNPTSTLTKKYPHSILTNRNSDESSRSNRGNENLMESNYSDENYQFNLPVINYSSVTDAYNQQLTSTNYLNQISDINITNQPIYESQITYNPTTGQHEQQLITCEQYYNSINKNLERREYSGCLGIFLNYYFQLSIDSWSRRLLLLILIINSIMAIINAAVLVWIVSYYYLSVNGIIDFNSDQIFLKGDVHFEKSIQLNSLSSIENEQLRIRSNNIILQDAKTDAQLCLNKIGHIIGEAEEFVLNDKEDDHQLNLGKSIQTRQLISKTNLNIISLNRKIQIETSGLINLESKNNLNLINNSTDPMQLKTRIGKISLNASSIEILDLQHYVPSKSGTSYPDIYQLCICSNGKLFVDTADGHCIIERSICEMTTIIFENRLTSSWTRILQDTNRIIIVP